jgi:hypothetical protein
MSVQRERDLALDDEEWKTPLGLNFFAGVDGDFTDWKFVRTNVKDP